MFSKMLKINDTGQMLPRRRINRVLNRAILASPFFLFPLFLLTFPEQMDTDVTYTYRSRAWRNEAATSGATVRTIPIIYAITATYSRPTQIPEMTRLAQTLMHVSNFLWIVVEQGTERSRSLNNLLRTSGISFVHLTAQENPIALQDCYPKKPFGSVHSRYAALEWIRQHAEPDGVVYMLDDDNCYDLRLFEEMRFTKKVSMWPVGLVGKYGISSPVIKNGKLIGFHDFRMKYRRFPVDYASFAVSVRLIREKQYINLGCQKGSNEDSYLNSLDLSLDDLEPRADNCTKVLVWHTKTQKAPPVQKKNLLRAKGIRKRIRAVGQTNLPRLYENLLKSDS
ncbi:galactosylgalactosylxylosylprotein 3-beta-glucuronosyltransferase S-like [Limulus polyphemus]|uniref:Galactosylgalactosylxylosylprotein 3-beta-glucuronosyltransferase n=1 Tax=Limulus polyphemus TaxID=6850 RepID=A0ABM1S5J7_LIMPO|nr:galactosylgalactosylxylosylprotein 3-beta-glucuronosyltransferase S-like [Limulus polyphemus]